MRAGDAELSAESTREVGDGVLLTLVVPEGAARLAVRLRGVGEDGAEGEAVIAVAAAAPPPWLEEAGDLRRKGAFDEALARTREAHAGNASDRVRALGADARVEMARGHGEAAERIFRESIALATAEGFLSDAAEDTFAGVPPRRAAAPHRGRARALDAIAPVLASYPDGAARLPYQRAILTRSSADFRTTFRLLDDARLAAERLGLDRDAWIARELYAVQLAVVGRDARRCPGCVTSSVNVARARSRASASSPPTTSR